MNTINIGISDQHRIAVCEHLNKLLADEYILYTQTLNYHWNVVDPYFDAMHAFFKKQYEELFELVDDIAERVRSLGEFALGTLANFATHAHIQEKPQQKLKTEDMIKNLLDNHEAIIRHIRKDIVIIQEQLGDEGTANFLTDKMEKHEKMAWMLRSCLQK
ncbi:DNA starvation/stationary phase protection protein [Candidatus Dependentiae bacterium Noda2021]|nr:DNA starvation/stationary phase protection protein [Candidatus Dependentiae bacterium Noda2021]